MLLDPGGTKRKSGVSVVPKVGCPEEQMVRNADYSVLPGIRIGNSGIGAQQPVFLSALQVIPMAATVGESLLWEFLIPRSQPV